MRSGRTIGLKEMLGAALLSCVIAGSVSAMTNRAVVKNDDTALTIDRSNKGDRLPQISLLRQRWNAPSLTPTSSEHISLGCDAAFSPIADPARARIFRRCMA
jgi:hypothetical protein